MHSPRPIEPPTQGRAVMHRIDSWLRHRMPHCAQCGVLSSRPSIVCSCAAEHCAPAEPLSNVAPPPPERQAPYHVAFLPSQRLRVASVPLHQLSPAGGGKPYRLLLLLVARTTQWAGLAHEHFSRGEGERKEKIDVILKHCEKALDSSNNYEENLQKNPWSFWKLQQILDFHIFLRNNPSWIRFL